MNESQYEVAKIIAAMLFITIVFISCSDAVYICTGPQSKVYHSSKHCKGLRRCSGELKSLPIDEAESIGRRECKWCYSD